MDFSVIVCTYNRAHSLLGCLQALAASQGVGALSWEVLVVDNNSTDDTAQVVQRLTHELPITIRYTFEPQQGLNHARNRGMRESHGRFFAFIDDDITVSPQWLSAIYESFLRHDADAVGGRIHLDPNLRLPRWIKDDETKGFLGFQDYGDEPFRMDGIARYPFGGNMAFNRRVIERIGYFNPMLGRKGAGRTRKELFKGAETDYFHRLAGMGDARIFYEPRAIVYHHVQPFQLTKKYLRTIHTNAGYQKAYFDDTPYPKRIMGVPRFYYPMLMRAAGRYLRLLITQGPDRAFRQQMTLGHTLGSMLGYYHRYRVDRS
ncbi:MAG: glycosyltransferase [Burkholderiales bacterium]|nr:glycosyltransferase [Burkholderiales bacterium]